MAESRYGGEGFLTGDLFQTPGRLAHGLCPAGGGVGQQQDVEPHLAIVFSDGDPGVDGGFCAATGMLDVLQMMIVRSISLPPVRGSSISANSLITSTTSPARSPQATTTTMSTVE